MADDVTAIEADCPDALHAFQALDREPVSIVDLLCTDGGADIEFEPERLGLTARVPEL